MRCRELYTAAFFELLRKRTQIEGLDLRGVATQGSQPTLLHG